MKKIFLTGFLVLGLLSSHVFAQMSSGQGGGMMDGGRMGGGWGWGSGYAWGYGIIILIIVTLVLSYMMKKK